ncbi:N-acetyltransferase family protein [Conyzicola sp.]|uniref:GNAT family N-acetyltransferase n=1 Tax=Conyzicola sp. TaxID=1969404 RepID=UPI0039896AB3
MAISIRLVEPSEYERVAQLTVAAYTADYDDLPADYLAELAAVEQRAVAHQVWVAVDDGSGRILGTMATGKPGRAISDLALDGEFDYRLLAVDPAARGRGIGRALTEFTYSLARERGLHTVVMNSGEHMLGAHRLYAGLGFARVPERERSVEISPGEFMALYVFARAV